MARIAQHRRTARRVWGLALVAALTLGISSASATSGTPQPSEEWDGVAPLADLGALGLADIREFDVLAGFDNDLLTVTITWDPGPALSYDLDLFVDQQDASGEWVQVGQSINSQLLAGEAEEVVEVLAPAPGRYRTRVSNFASTEVAYHGSIVFAMLAVEHGGGGGGGPTARIVTSGWIAPVKVTPENGHGYEPTLVTDPHGNAFATAHPENWQIVVAPDPNSPDGARSQSWMWHSADLGSTWKNPPGFTPLSVEDQEPGIEGDLAFDDANHLYFVDTYGTDVTLTRWTVTGLDQVAFDFTRPILPAVPAVDDRPWITAHGDGHVFYFGNDGTKLGDGGRYTVHRSLDGGNTWDSVGVVLPDSGWCRPASDHRAGVHVVYATCTNDNGTLYLYVSVDEGVTWQRHEIGAYNPEDSTDSWPTIEVGPDGTIWVLYLDSNDLGSGGVPNSSQLRLFRSTDGGIMWSSQDVTPVPGRYDYQWLSVSADGRRLGLGVYYRPTNADPWRVYGATWKAGGRILRFASLDQDNPVAPAARTRAPGDYLNSAFFPDGRLGVVWTRIELTVPGATVIRDIYFSRQS